MMDWKSWPIYNVLCFTVIPLRLRPMTSGVASMIWNAYVSHQVCLALEGVPKTRHVGIGRMAGTAESGEEEEQGAARRLAGPSATCDAREQALLLSDELAHGCCRSPPLTLPYPRIVLTQSQSVGYN